MTENKQPIFTAENLTTYIENRVAAAQSYMDDAQMVDAECALDQLHTIFGTLDAFQVEDESSDLRINELYEVWLDLFSECHQVKRAANDYLLGQLVEGARYTRKYGDEVTRSMNERLAVALVLNRADWLGRMGYTVAEAIARIGPDTVALIPQAAGLLEAE